MRGTKVQGRFKIDFENKSINEGVVDELRDPVGSIVDWWVWDATYMSTVRRVPLLNTTEVARRFEFDQNR